MPYRMPPPARHSTHPGARRGAGRSRPPGSVERDAAAGPADSGWQGVTARQGNPPVHFVIMGCGRVGSTLARSLETQRPRRGRHRRRRRRLPPARTVLRRADRVTGVGFDRGTLDAASIKEAYAFAAVSSGDNSNILSARVARETFGIEHVVARIYDPGRAEVYQRLGIPTVATVRWTADQMIQRLMPQGTVPELTGPQRTDRLAEVPSPMQWIGRRLTDSRSRRAPASPTSPGSARALVPRPETDDPAGRPRARRPHAR